MKIIRNEIFLRALYLLRSNLIDSKIKKTLTNSNIKIVSSLFNLPYDIL